MPDYRRRHCDQPPRGCGQHDSKVGAISWRGLCLGCGKRNQDQCLTEQDARSGPIFQHWRRRIAASVGAPLFDEAPPES